MSSPLCIQALQIRVLVSCIVLRTDLSRPRLSIVAGRVLQCLLGPDDRPSAFIAERCALVASIWLGSGSRAGQPFLPLLVPSCSWELLVSPCHLLRDIPPSARLVCRVELHSAQGQLGPAMRANCTVTERKRPCWCLVSRKVGVVGVVLVAGYANTGRLRRHLAHSLTCQDSWGGFSLEGTGPCAAGLSFCSP